MSELIEDEIPTAVSKPMRRISPLWLIPIVTVIVGIAMVYHAWTQQGPLITIEFSSAEGLEAHKTKIKTREVEIGQVEDIGLNKDLSGVIVSARIHQEFADLLVEGSRFWVIEPSISLAGVSGLETILTGQYIQLSPGNSAKREDHFVGLNAPPLTPLGTPGRRIHLTTDGDFSFAAGDKITYRGINVGRIEEFEFNFQDGKIYYSAFIDAPYDQLITRNTRFWKNSGIRAELTSQGFAVESVSLDSILTGGITFTTPGGAIGGEAVTDDSLFYVYPNRSAINEKQYVYALQYWLLVKKSIGGLSAGSPVTYRGVEIGKVLRTDYIPDGQNLLDKSFDIPVLIEINPGRLGLPDTEESLKRAADDIGDWIKQGLTATIKTQNFLLGQQLVNLDYSPVAGQVALNMFRDLPVIPSGIDTIERFTVSIEEFFAKVNQLPVESLIAKLETVLDDGSATLASYRELAQTGNELINGRQITQAVEQLNRTLAAVQDLARSYSDNSEISAQLQQTLQAMTALLEEFRPLVADVKRQPNTLIFGSEKPPEKLPERKRP
jgi:paraquat-inducible protein B